MEWTVDVETVNGVLPADAELEDAAARLRESAGSADCLVAFHPVRRSLAAWMCVTADDAATALRTAESALAEALGRTARDLVSAAAVRKTSGFGGG